MLFQHHSLLTPSTHQQPTVRIRLICCPVTITQQTTFTSQLLPSHQCSSPQPQPIHRLCGISHLLQQRDPLQLPQNRPQFRILSSPQCQGMSLLSPLPFQPPPCLQTSSSLLARGSQNSKDWAIYCLHWMRRGRTLSTSSTHCSQGKGGRVEPQLKQPDLLSSNPSCPETISTNITSLTLFPSQLPSPPPQLYPPTLPN